MLFKSTTAVALLAAAAQAVAEPQPFKSNNARMLMSVHDMFGVVARDDVNVYSPSETLCGLGQSCSEACGTGYQTCQSSDNAIHCYNPTTQVCCPDGSGNSCDEGYYCAGSSGDLVVCCPEGQSLADCAKNYGLDKALTTEVAAPTSSSSAPPSSSSTSTTSSSSSVISSSSSIPSSSIAPNSTSSIVSTTTHKTHGNYTTITSTWGTGLSSTPCPTTTAAAAATPASSNNFTSVGGPSATASSVSTSAAGSVKAAGAAVALLAAGFALLL